MYSKDPNYFRTTRELSEKTISFVTIKVIPKTAISTDAILLKLSSAVIIVTSVSNQTWEIQLGDTR